MTTYIGCAGWSISKEYASHFLGKGALSQLERYASRFNCVEINSSFYRPHQPKTYARWSASVPSDFRFSSKVPREITHDLHLIGCKSELEKYLSEVTELGENLGPLLVQLPPSLSFSERIVGEFFTLFRRLHDGPIICEPRHLSWFKTEVFELLQTMRIGVAAVDPPIRRRSEISEEHELPKRLADVSCVYYRLHGYPDMYRSRYEDEYLQRMVATLQADSAGSEVWCIFDNTMYGFATLNAIELQAMIGGSFDNHDDTANRKAGASNIHC